MKIQHQPLLVLRLPFTGHQRASCTDKGHTVTVRVRQPAIEHHVRVAEFENWLARNGKSPAEMALKVRLRSILASKTENQ
jgi:hypothetical protein